MIDVLQKAKKPLSGTEIAKQLNQDDVKIFHLIKKMLKYNEIKCIELNRKQAKKYYHGEKEVKRRMRIYYV